MPKPKMILKLLAITTNNAPCTIYANAGTLTHLECLNEYIPDPEFLFSGDIIGYINNTPIEIDNDLGDGMIAVINADKESEHLIKWGHSDLL